jgi:hypothetical protein
MARSIAELKAALQKALARKGAVAGVVAAEAAKLVEDHGLVDETQALVAAFTKLSEPKRDPGCRGRIAIVSALYSLDHWVPEVFEAGLRVVQIEGDPRFPGNDSGAQVRGACAQAHAHFNRPNGLDVCAEMLADKEVAARVGAARGLGGSGHIDATAVLHYKLALAPDDGEVLAACHDALFALHRDRATELAIRQLALADERGDAAALALGSNRVIEARDDLIAWCRRDPRRRQAVGYLALALLRDDAANAELERAIEEGSTQDAEAAKAALATFR